MLTHWSYVYPDSCTSPSKCRHSNNQVRTPYIYESGTWAYWDDFIYWYPIFNWVSVTRGCFYRFAPRQWEMSLHNNAVSHWLDANLESALVTLLDNRSAVYLVVSAMSFRACWCWGMFLLLFLAATKQLYAALSVRPSVCLSCLSVTPFSLCSCHRMIMKFSGVITIDKSYVHAKGHSQRSRVKVTWAEKSTILTRIEHFRTVEW